MSKILKSAGPTNIVFRKSTSLVGTVLIFGHSNRAGIEDPTGGTLKCLKVFPVRIVDEDFQLDFKLPNNEYPIFAIIEPVHLYDTEIVSLLVEKNDLDKINNTL